MLNFCEVKKEFHAGLCIFQPHKNRHFDHFFFSIKCLPLLKIFVIIVLLQCLLRRLYPKRYHDYSNGGHFRFSTLKGINFQILNPKKCNEHSRHFYMGAPLPRAQRGQG